VSVYIPLELLQQMLDTAVPELMRSNIVDAVHAFQVCVYIYNYIYIYICVYIQLTLTLTLNPNPTTTYIE
jgi:cytochrome c biogenesis factor